MVWILCDNQNCPVQPSLTKPMAIGIAKLRWNMSPGEYRRRFNKGPDMFRRDKRWKNKVPKIANKFKEAMEKHGRK